MNFIKEIKLFLKGFNDRTRIGFYPSHILFGKYKKARKLWKQIDYLDKRYDEEFVQGKNVDEFRITNFATWSGYDSKFLSYLFSDRMYLNDKGEDELYKELERRRDERYEYLKDVIDVSYLPKQIREERLSKILDK
ncbi:MAG: hypothetical protein SLAVMIC_00519 [uncultured marine phage]|uniref:Uncharacterized protein n=1 Tax=uncultured marine phage TaxID=707152 RepID=A0A8D9C921_9VIRU|nr:MAG: hypothetical protein SLAVMIC_00519 [uncultured marine phage]